MDAYLYYPPPCWIDQPGPSAAPFGDATPSIVDHQPAVVSWSLGGGIAERRYWSIVRDAEAANGWSLAAVLAGMPPTADPPPRSAVPVKINPAVVVAGRLAGGSLLRIKAAAIGDNRLDAGLIAHLRDILPPTGIVVVQVEATTVDGGFNPNNATIPQPAPELGAVIPTSPSPDPPGADRCKIETTLILR